MQNHCSKLTECIRSYKHTCQDEQAHWRASSCDGMYLQKTMHVVIDHVSMLFLHTATVPGLTGSQLSAKVNSSSFLCNTNGRYDRIWVSLTRLLDGCSEAEL